MYCAECASALQVRRRNIVSAAVGTSQDLLESLSERGHEHSREALGPMCIVKGDLDDRTIAGAGAAGTLGRSEGVSGRLVGPAAFKAVEVSLTWHLVGSIPIHSRNAARFCFRRGGASCVVLLFRAAVK